MRAALVVVILGFVPGLLDPFTPLKAAALHAAGAAALAAMLADALLARRAPRLRAFTALDVAVVLFVLVAIAATCASVSPRLSLFGEIGQREGLATILALAALYAAARRGHGPKDIARTLGVVLAASGAAAVYALVQVAGRDPLVWSGAALYPAGSGAVLRPAATLGNAILLGVVLAAALALVVGRLATRAGDPWREGPLAALLAVVLTATLSRGALLAGVAGVLAALALAWRAAPRPRSPRPLLVACGCAALPPAAWTLLVLRAPFMARLAEDAHAGAVSTPARLAIARGALAIARAHPLLGGGPDTFGLLFPGVMRSEFWRNEWLGIPVHAHSALLQVLATLGSLGVLALLALVVAAARAARPLESAQARIPLASALAALLVAGLGEPLGLAGATLLVVLAALLVTREEAPEDLPLPARSRALVLAAALLAAAGVAVFEAPWPALAAAARAREALERSLAATPADRARLLEYAARQAERAAEGAPSEDELWRLASDASLLHAGVLDARDATAGSALAEAQARRALALEPRRASNLQRLALALAGRARLAAGPAALALASASESTFAQASRLAPADAVLLSAEARCELERRDWRAALATAERIVALYPDAATGHVLVAISSLGAGDEPRAHAEFVRALAARWEAGTEAQHAQVRAMLATLERRAGSAR